MKDILSTRRCLALLILSMFVIAEIRTIQTQAITVCSVKKVNSQQIVCESPSNTSLSVRCQDSYSNQKNDTDFKMCMRQVNGLSELQIKLFNKKTFRSFELLINQKFIASSRDKSIFFTEPEDFMNLFRDDFANVQITQNGVMKYHYSFGKTKKIMLLVAEQVTDNFKEMMIGIVGKQGQAIENLIKQNKILREQASRKDQISKTNQQKASNLVKSLEAKMKETSEILDKQDLSTLFCPIDHQDCYLFKMQNLTPSSYIIRKTGGNGAWHSFFLTPTLKIGGITSFKFRLFHRDIWLGLATSALFGATNEAAWKNMQTLSLNVGAGNLHIRNAYTQPIPGYPEHTIVEMIVDTTKWTVTWILNKDRVVSESIHESMRNKPIYPQIVLVHTGTAVEVFK